MSPRVFSYLLWSLVLHGAALSWPHENRNARQIQPIAINYSTKIQKTKSGKKKLKLSPKAGPRIGSEAYLRQRRALGITAAAQNFLERLKAHIEPNWQFQVQQSGARPVSCSTTLYIDAYPNGTVLRVYTNMNNCPAALQAAAIKTIQTCNLLPAPKILLAKSGLFELSWTFTLTKKD